MLRARLAAILLLLLSCFIYPEVVSAHGSGPPYVMIEGEYAQSNPILSYVASQSLTLGADVASASGYLVGERLLFDIDLQFFPNAYAPVTGVGTPQLGLSADMPTPQFQWDFGDGSAPQVGTLVSHAYEKAGTYMVDLQVRYPEKPTEFGSVNTIQVDILPEAGYERTLPKIVVNGTTIENPARDIISITPAKPVQMEVRTAGAAPVSYAWDLGNEETAQGERVETRYSRDDYFPVVLLRTIDAHGLWTDTYALLDLPLGSPNPLVRFWYMIVDFVTSLVAR